MMDFSALKELITAKYPEAIVGEDLSASPKALIVDENYLHDVCEYLHAHQQTYFDSLSCVTGVDNGIEKNTMEMVYNLYSIPYDIHLMIKVVLDRANPGVDSLSDIWHTANWQERETFDLFGIHFNNHPDLRRILLPNDWEGYPLRKDYKEQEKYHGMTVIYDRNEEAKWKDEEDLKKE